MAELSCRPESDEVHLHEQVGVAQQCPHTWPMPQLSQNGIAVLDRRQIASLCDQTVLYTHTRTHTQAQDLCGQAQCAMVICVAQKHCLLYLVGPSDKPRKFWNWASLAELACTSQAERASLSEVIKGSLSAELGHVLIGVVSHAGSPQPQSPTRQGSVAHIGREALALQSQVSVQQASPSTALPLLLVWNPDCQASSLDRHVSLPLCGDPTSGLQGVPVDTS